MRKLFDEHDDGLFVQEDAGVFWDARERGLCQSGHLQDHSAVTCIWARGKCKAGRENEPVCAGSRTGQLRAAEGMREGQDKGMQNRAARWELADLWRVNAVVLMVTPCPE